MLSNNYRDSRFEFEDEVDRVLALLKESDPPVPRARVAMTLNQLRFQQVRQAPRRSFSPGLRLFLPTGAAAAFLAFFICLTFVLHAPETATPTSTLVTAAPTSQVSVTVAQETQTNQLRENAPTPDRVQLVQLNLSLGPGTYFTAAPVPFITPASTRSNP